MIDQYARDHAMTRQQVIRFDREWTEICRQLKSYDYPLNIIVFIPKRTRRNSSH